MSKVSAEQFQEMQEALSAATKAAEMSNAQAEYMQEAFSDSVRQMLQMDDVGWIRYTANDTIGPSLEEARSIATSLRDWTTTNALLWRGREIRNSYLFGAPYEVGVEDAEGKITPQQRNVLKNPVNLAAVFSAEALSVIEGSRYTDGNAFVMYNKATKTFSPIPFEQISDIYYNPDNPMEVWYWERTYTRRVMDPKTSAVESKEVKVWYPSDTYAPGSGGFFKQINQHPVESDKRMVDSRVNLRPGHTLGIPDAFAAAPWALAYSAYLRDGTKVLAALAEWAWKITPKKKDVADRAAAAVRNSSGAGGTIISDMDVQSLPKGNAVDLGTGRPLASQVAAALGISIVVLLSDPGQSGAYGTAQTLTDPTNRTLRNRRELNSEFIIRCCKLIGIKDPEVVWEKMSPGTDKEEMEILAMALGTGLFHGDELRPMIAKLAEITLLHEEAPEGFMLPNNVDSIARKDVDDDGQQPAADGSNAMTNGQGKDNLGLGKVSATPSDVKATGTTTKPAV